MSTMIFKKDEIIQLCKVDAEIIAKSLSISKSLGITAIRDSVSNYRKLLSSHKGDFVPSMDLDYRTYIVNLLKLAIELTTAESDKAVIFSKIIFA